MVADRAISTASAACHGTARQTATAATAAAARSAAASNGTGTAARATATTAAAHMHYAAAAGDCITCVACTARAAASKGAEPAGFTAASWAWHAASKRTSCPGRACPRQAASAHACLCPAPPAGRRSPHQHASTTKAANVNGAAHIARPAATACQRVARACAAAPGVSWARPLQPSAAATSLAQHARRTSTGSCH
jgi:trimeric autotransporter adhesin